MFKDAGEEFFSANVGWPQGKMVSQSSSDVQSVDVRKIHDMVCLLISPPTHAMITTVSLRARIDPY
jgi:hypothetical protein